MKIKDKYISVIIPCHNEEDNVIPLYTELKEVLKSMNCEFEIIFIDDGSTDKTANVLKEIKDIKVITMRRSFGQTAGVDAGIKHAYGNIIVTMDGDLQNDPHDIPAMVAKLDDFDGVLGWRKNRHDTISKKLFSKGARYLRRVIFKDDLHDAGCGLKVFKKECFDNLDLYGEMHRFIHLILKSRGFNITEVEINHRPRVKGKTKYNWTRAVKAFSDMLTILFWRRYLNRPMHMFGTFGIFLISTGVAGIFAMVFIRIFITNLSYDTMLIIIFSGAILAGLQMFLMGILADIMAKILYSTAKEKPYYISSIKTI